MGIGTSRGAFYDDELQHQAGIPTLPKGDEEMVKAPKDTGDDNVLPPDEGSYDNKSGVIQAGFKEATDRLFGLNGVERYKLWPERMLDDLNDTAGDVSAGKIPMWSMTPDGEFHTSIEGLEAAHKLMPAANSLPVTVHLRGAGLSALEQYHEAPYETGAHDQFLQLLNQVRRQPSNIRDINDVDTVFDALRSNNRLEPRINEYIREGEGGRLEHVHEILPPEAPYYPDPGLPSSRARLLDRMFADEEAASVARDFADAGEANPYQQQPVGPRFHEVVHPDQMSDAEFLRWGEWQPYRSLTREQNARWSRLDAEDASRGSEYTYDQDPGPYEPLNSVAGRFNKTEVKEARLQDKVKLIKEERPAHVDSRYHNYIFANNDGVGTLNLVEKNSGKDLWVEWIGSVSNRSSYAEDAHTFGGMSMRQIIMQLKDEFPKAERVGGFRVSGARGITGSNDAWMRIRKSAKSSLEQAYDKYQAEKDQ